jgi:hypothetical protein
MQQGRVSTIRFNEWICVCAQYEKAIARVGRQVYQGYSRGLISDNHAIELCKEISQCFADSKKLRAEMEEELERDALRGLSAEEAKAAEEALELTASEKAIRQIRLKVTKLLGRSAVNRSLATYRNRVVELSRDLGLRAVALHDTKPLLKMEAHTRLCQLAVKLNEDSNQKWEEITRSKNDKGGMDLSFHTMLITFVTSFASFSRGSAIGKMILKLLKYDPKEEEKKLTKQYEGSKTADALVAQMAEVEEPDPDIGREMATMEKDYVETPTEWNLPPVTESWIPDTSDNWPPPGAGDTAAPAAASPAAAVLPPAPAVEKPKPQVLRRRQAEPLSGAEAWLSSSEPEPEPWIPPATSPARIGQNPMLSSEPEEDWASEEVSEEDFPAAPAPRLGSAPPSLSSGMPPKPAAPAPRAVTPPEPITPPVAPPPVARPRSAEIAPPLPPLPPLEARPIRSLDLSTSGTFAPPEPGKPTLPLSEPVKHGIPPSKPSDDPLLRLLRTDPLPEVKNDDDLLPAFLRERQDDDPSDSSTFIPDLPDSVDSGLKILPFGSQPKSDDNDSFIPKMPE